MSSNLSSSKQTPPAPGDRELLVLRHGKAEPDGPSDFERALTIEGERICRAVGRWLAAQGHIPDAWIASPARRTRETLEAVADGSGMGSVVVNWEPTIYEASVDGLVAALARLPQRPKRALLIGHNPGLTGLVEHLVGDALRPAQRAQLLPTATLVRLAMPQDWSELGRGSASVIEIVPRPAAMPGSTR